MFRTSFDVKEHVSEKKKLRVSFSVDNDENITPKRKKVQPSDQPKKKKDDREEIEHFRDENKCLRSEIKKLRRVAEQK
jgi:hypothetical protein